MGSKKIDTLAQVWVRNQAGESQDTLIQDTLIMNTGSRENKLN